MIRRAIALRYSKALFDQDIAKGNLEKRVNDFVSLLELLKRYPDLMKLLEAPQFSLEEKEKVLKASFTDLFDSTFSQFLFYLLKKRRFKDLKQIATEYRLMVDEKLEIWEAKMVTAVPINEEVEKELKEKLENFYRKKIKIKKEVDPTILGGATLVVIKEMIDRSVKGRLKNLKEHLLETDV